MTPSSLPHPGYRNCRLRLSTPAVLRGLTWGNVEWWECSGQDAVTDGFCPLALEGVPTTAKSSRAGEASRRDHRTGSRDLGPRPGPPLHHHRAPLQPRRTTPPHAGLRTRTVRPGGPQEQLAACRTRRPRPGPSGPIAWRTAGMPRYQVSQTGRASRGGRSEPPSVSAVQRPELDPSPPELLRPHAERRAAAQRARTRGVASARSGNRSARRTGRPH